jgi:hypothetical protein
MGKLDLNKLEEKLDNSLNNETSEGLNNWLDEKRAQSFIEQEFIPNQAALLMREIHFDEPCLKYKWNDAEVSLWMSHSSKPSCFHTQDFWTENDLFTISIPTFSQCFKWFRERKLLGLIHPIDDWDSWAFSILAEDCMSPFFKIGEGDEYKSPEEAKLACLKKLIEIVKQK